MERHTVGTFDSTFPPQTVLAGSTFWEAQARRFGAVRNEALAHRQSLLDAVYHPNGWGLEHTGAFGDRSSGRWLLHGGNSPLVEEFKSTASLCAVALGLPNTDSAWADWLECLRHEAGDFNPKGMSTSSWAIDVRPEPEFEVAVTGLLRPPSEIRPDPDPPMLSVDLGEIDDVCGASDRVCRRLADEALKVELAPTADNARPRAEVQPQRPVSTPATPDTSKTMTLKEAASRLRVSEDTLQRMHKRDEIKLFKVGSRWRVLASEVIRLRQEPRFQNR